MLIRKTTEHYWPLGGSPLITPPLARPRHEGSGAERRAGSRLRRRGHPMGRSGTGDEGDRASSRRTGTAQKRHPRNGSGGTAYSPNCCYSPPNLYIRLFFLNTLPMFKIIIISFTRRSFGSILSFVNTATHFNNDVAGPALPRRSSRSSLTSPCPQDARHLALLCFLHRNE